ncbi:MAG: peptide-methionine (S)-S-oxide reductase MsrA [Candidatus Latescibacterota bacterium]|nr:MAG: peptide-methionine (S)-S-oxide reductase MsrA [Candidatus Latescibacterota bacterium]
MNEKNKPAKESESKLEVATLGGGCFWCLEAVFEELKGVQGVVSGYSGGSLKSPSYEQVCSGTTGHAEVVQVRFDPEVVGFEEILDVFFSIHDPTTLNRQGADVGTRYRSVVFYHDDQQKQIVEKKIAEIESSGDLPRPVVTQVVPLKVFYEAEEYHQNYFKRNPEAGYCRAVIVPKVKKFQDVFKDKLK